ncbi:MAG: hypothetical protein Q9166_003955 [cf. Caloplaca sp. 2 TL-2023]
MVGPKELLYGLAVLFNQVIIPLCCACSSAQKDHSDWAEHRARQHKLKERPDYPPRRKRNISQVLLSPSPKPLPPLFRLPLELRLVIYKLVLGGNRFNLKHVPKHVVLGKRLYMEAVHVRGGTMCKQQLDWKMQLHHLSLALTCRQLYQETIDLLYSYNTFVIDDPHVLVNFATFCLQPQRLHAIKNLELTWKQPQPIHYHVIDDPYDKTAWEESWTVITTRLRLVSLKVFLRTSNNSRPAHDPNIYRDWLRPLLTVVNVPDMELVWYHRHEDALAAEHPVLFEQLKECERDVVTELERNGNRVKSCIKK